MKAVTDFNRETAITLGGWDKRYVRVIAVEVDGDVAASLVDANGDGADVNIDIYVRGTDGEWSNVVSGNGDAVGNAEVVATRTSDDRLILTRTEDASE